MACALVRCVGTDGAHRDGQSAAGKRAQRGSAAHRHRAARALHDGQAHRGRTGRCGVRIEGLAHADGLQLAQGVGDVLVVLGECVFLSPGAE
ncbi:hypothetical protein GCM10027074_75330 [Streptomyces deserti]